MRVICKDEGEGYITGEGRKRFTDEEKYEDVAYISQKGMMEFNE